MKDKRTRPSRLTWRTGLVGLLLPMALVTSAQTPLRWNVRPADSAPSASGDVPTRPASGPAYLPAVEDPMPLAEGFDVRQFEAIAQQLVANQRVPGLAMAIVHDGRVLSARGYGITDVDNAEPVGAHTVFRLASLSKAFAGTVTGMLVNEGALRWDSHITDYLPSLQFSEPGAAQQLTVAEVLSQRVGLTHNAYDLALENNVDYRTLVHKLAYAPMVCAPGECYSYQNVAFSLIGDVVFGASGTFYSEEVARRIFKPLGMNDASFGLEGIEASASWARPHVRAGSGWRSLIPKPAYYRVAPAAGVNASISDMTQWLLAQGGHRPEVLTAPLLATLHAPVVSTPSEIRGSWRRQRLNAAGYAIGWRVYDYGGHRVVYHAGAVQGYRGMVALMPQRDLGVAILWNSTSGLPSGLLPTILDRAIGLPVQRWLDDDVYPETLYVDNDVSQPSDASLPVSSGSGGAETSASTATPR